jgi:glycine betaine/proline transport system ATP-binding protein
VNRAKVMSAQSLMTRGKAAGQHAGKVAAKAKVETFAADIVAASAPFAVTDQDGKLLGEIAPQAVIDLLAGRKTKEARI